VELNKKRINKQGDLGIVKVKHKILILIVVSTTLAKDFCNLLKFFEYGFDYTKAD
jgi:hypothetical protein